MHFSIKGQNSWTNSGETVSFTVKDWMKGLKGSENKKLKKVNQLLLKAWQETGKGQEAP